MNQIKLFFKTKDHEDPRAYVRIHTYAHACSRPACACFMHAYIYTSMCVHVKVPEIMKDKFFCIKTWFGMNPTSSAMNGTFSRRMNSGGTTHKIH